MLVWKGGVDPLIELLSDANLTTQRHATSALWGLAEGKEGVYDKQIVEAGGIQPLLSMLLLNNEETRGFAAACLSCCIADNDARQLILKAGGAEPLLALVHSPSTWLRGQATQMLKALGVAFKEPESVMSPRALISPRSPGRNGGGAVPLSLPLIAQKTLPIRKERHIDPEKDNPRIGELQRGDTVFVVERVQVVGGTWRSLVAREPGGAPQGWVTSSREGVEFLVSEGEAKDATMRSKMKYHVRARRPSARLSLRVSPMLSLLVLCTCLMSRSSSRFK